MTITIVFLLYCLIAWGGDLIWYLRSISLTTPFQQMTSQEQVRQKLSVHEVMAITIAIISLFIVGSLMFAVFLIAI